MRGRSTLYRKCREGSKETGHGVSRSCLLSNTRIGWSFLRVGDSGGAAESTESLSMQSVKYRVFMTLVVRPSLPTARLMAITCVRALRVYVRMGRTHKTGPSSCLSSFIFHPLLLLLAASCRLLTLCSSALVRNFLPPRSCVLAARSLFSRVGRSHTMMTQS